MEEQSQPPINVALCVTNETMNRVGRVMRHLAVGLVDAAVPLRLLSSDPRVESLSLGPIQTIIHQPIKWPVAGRRLKRLLEVLAHQPPTIVHAMSQGSYRTAGAIAEHFDADLIQHVSSIADIDAVNRGTGRPAAKLIATSRPLSEMLTHQLRISADRVELIRPGLMTSPQLACFSDSIDLPSILCTSSLDRTSGVELLIDAIASLRKRKIEVMVFLLGKGRHESALRKNIRQKGLLSSFTIASPLGNLMQAMDSADIFVRPCEETAFYTSSLLAMAAGMAVVTYSNEACDHFIDGKTAILCHDDSPEALANALERYINDVGYARQMARHAQEHVKTNHSMSRMAELTATIYRQLALQRATLALKGN